MKIDKSSTFLLFSFFIAFVFQFLVTKNVIHYKFYYVTLLIGIGISLYLIPFKLISIIMTRNENRTKIIPISSLIINYLFAGLVVYTSVILNSKMQIAFVSVAGTNLLLLTFIYLSDNKEIFRKKLLEHIIFQLFPVFYMVLIF